MVDRLSLGDLAFAILLALPLAVFARPAALPQDHNPTVQPVQAAAASPAQGSGRVSVLG